MASLDEHAVPAEFLELHPSIIRCFLADHISEYEEEDDEVRGSAHRSELGAEQLANVPDDGHGQCEDPGVPQLPLGYLATVTSHRSYKLTYRTRMIRPVVERSASATGKTQTRITREPLRDAVHVRDLIIGTIIPMGLWKPPSVYGLADWVTTREARELRKHVGKAQPIYQLRDGFAIYPNSQADGPRSDYAVSCTEKRGRWSSSSSSSSSGSSVTADLDMNSDEDEKSEGLQSTVATAPTTAAPSQAVTFGRELAAETEK